MIGPNLYLRFFGWFRVRMIGWVGVHIVELDARRCVIRIPLRRRTKNHLNSLYFGVFAVGADVAGGLMAVERIRSSGQPIHFVFKDLKAEFLKRAEGDTYFTCEDGEAVEALVAEAARTRERVERRVRVVATVPDKLGTEHVATFELTLSLKRRSG